MKAYKLEILVIDFDELGGEDIKLEIENTRYSNRCISPDVISVKEVDIGEWDDNHPLNSHLTMEAEYNRLFNNGK